MYRVCILITFQCDQVTTAGFRIAEDFSEPSTSSLPPRPISLPLPVPGPRKPTDVMEDFSKCKPPAQTAINTFYTSIEPWLRPIREDEVGLLQYDVCLISVNTFDLLKLCPG